MAMNCLTCHNHLPEHAAFCSRCGRRVVRPRGGQAVVVTLFVVGGIFMLILLFGVGASRSSSRFTTVQPITVTPSEPAMRYPTTSWPPPPKRDLVEVYQERAGSSDQATIVRKQLEGSVRHSR